MEDDNESPTKYASPTPSICSRATIIGILLIAFSAAKLPWVSSNISRWSTYEATYACMEVCEFINCFNSCGASQQFFIAYSVMRAGLMMIIIFSILGICKPVVKCMQCNHNRTICGFIVMIGLILGGLCYMMGYWIVMNYLISFTHPYQSAMNWRIAALFFEFYLGGSVAIIFGVDCYVKILDKKQNRIFAILTQLVMVSLVCFIAYRKLGVVRNQTEPMEDVWQLFLIAIGYILILMCCLSFIVYSFKKSLEYNNLISSAIGIMLLIGAIVTSIGYWIDTYED
eukprot:393827_1